MKNLCCSYALVLSCLLGSATAEDFAGWQGLRVIEQKGRPYVLRTADIDGDGRQEAIVVNYRSSRLDIYSWLEDDQRETVTLSQPNELPMAPEMKHGELQLEQVPRDLVVHDLDGDDQPELVVLVSSPSRILIYSRDADGAWARSSKYDLLEGKTSSRRQALLLRESLIGEFSLLVSLNNGIQQLALKEGARAEWLTPREEKSRTQWWLADMDGDGRQDLIEQTRESSEPLRWYRGLEGGKLAPAVVLYDRSVSDAEVYRTRDSVELALIDGSVRQLMRRYHLEVGDSSPFGLRHPLAMSDALKSAWCGMKLGDQQALIAADRKRPQLLCYMLEEAGWSSERSFPAVSGINAVASPAAQGDTLLIWAKDAADLLISRWENDRLSYPRPMEQSAEITDRKILALSTVGDTTWWVQKVGSDLDLYRWSPGEGEPVATRFEGAGKKASEVLWIGGDRLLMKETHSRSLKSVVLQADETIVTSPSHLKKASLDEYRLLRVGNELKIGRIVEGVLQWIGEDLQSYEQIMLPQGQELADYVSLGQREGWALQSDSPYVHHIQIDDSGLSSANERVKVASGVRLVRDPVLGVLLIDHDRLTHMSEGMPLELKLIEAVDERVGRSGGVRKTGFHRLGKADIDGDGYDELLLFDELEHRITALSDQGGALKPKIAWPVFDDKVYPYGDEYESLVHEPRAVVALDLDGDGNQDLAMLSQDRLILYLARDQQR